MCGRFTQHCERERLQLKFDAEIPKSYQPSFNLAPSQDILAIAERNYIRRATMLRWGLIPSWADDPTSGHINARSEEVQETRSFRDAFRSRRCLIPADGWFEWQVQGKEKTPFYIHLGDDEPFAFAGVWDVNEKMGRRIASCAILTTEANAATKPIHHRQPVILAREDYDLWLDADAQPAALRALLRPYEGADLVFHQVSKSIGSPRNNGPSFIEPVVPDPSLSLFDADSDP
jgi:putative SOS response-associated peptidase YedK